MTPTEFQILSARIERLENRQTASEHQIAALEDLIGSPADLIAALDPKTFLEQHPQTSPTIDDQFEPRQASLSDVLQASIEKESRERKKRPWVQSHRDGVWHYALDGDGDKNAVMLCSKTIAGSPVVSDAIDIETNTICSDCHRLAVGHPKCVIRETAIIDDRERNVKGLAGAASELMAPDESYPVAQDNPVTNHDARFLRDVAELLDIGDEDSQMPGAISRHVPKRLHEIACKIERSFGTKTPIIRKESESRNSK